jgi:hypothetical protein
MARFLKDLLGRRFTMTAPRPRADSQWIPSVLVVGAGPEVLPNIGPLVGNRRLSVDFIGFDDMPYTAVRRRRPDLVVLCFTPDDADACHVMAMLQMDPVTARTPILTWVAGEAYAIIASGWRRTRSETPGVSSFSAHSRAR